MIPSTADLLAGVGVTAAFLCIVAIAEAWRRWGSPDPESTRKLIHIAGGIVALLLPHVIASHLVVLGMALGMGLLFFGGKLLGKLQSLHGVSRRSSGTEYYPLVIYLLFFLARDEPWKYTICVLVLATADALAALVGSRYGRLRYEVDRNYKSVEGSLVFFVVTMLVVLIPLVAWPMSDPPSLAVSCLVALLVAILATGLEAIAQDGSDNFWVPLGTLVIIDRALQLPAIELAQRVAVLTAICLLLGIAAWWTFAFNVGGTIVLILAAYACWTLTSIDWAMPVFSSLLFYLGAVLTVRGQALIPSTPVLKSLSLPFLIIMAAAIAQDLGGSHTYRFLYGPFIVGCVAIAALSSADRASQNPHASRRRKRFVTLGAGSLGTSLLTSLLVAFPAYTLQPGVSLAALLGIAAILLLVEMAVAVLLERIERAGEREWWLLRTFLIMAAMGLSALFQSLGVSPLWNPR